MVITSFFFNDPATTEIYTLSLHDALPISCCRRPPSSRASACRSGRRRCDTTARSEEHTSELQSHVNIVCRLLLEKKKVRDPAHHEHGLRLAIDYTAARRAACHHTASEQSR